MPLPPGRARAFEAAGKQGCACVAWSRKRRSGLISRQGVYESPSSSSYTPTCGQSVPKCDHTPGKVAGQRATVKAEMNGFTPGLDLRPLSRWMGGQGGQSLKVLGRSLSDFEVFSFSKLNNQNKFFRLKKFYLLSSSMPYFFFCRIT